MSDNNAQPDARSDLIDLARSLLTKGPHKFEKTTRRVRALFDKTWLFDTTSAYHVWEHPYYPQYYIPSSDIKNSWITKDKGIDDGESVFLAAVHGEKRVSDRVLVFEKGPLAGLTRLEFKQMDAWYEEDQFMVGHPKDPYKRIDILPSSRKITIKVGDVIVAESTLNMFLFETMLRTRYYMPKTAIQWQYTTPSDTTTLCPYKGMAEYYNLNVDGKEIKDAIWWYRYPTHESAPIAAMACFYNEKVDVFVDGVKEEK
ncbi:MAG: hypothetical protein Q9181_000546 [Wetmoreana brouardii]